MFILKVPNMAEVGPSQENIARPPEQTIKSNLRTRLKKGTHKVQSVMGRFIHKSPQETPTIIPQEITPAPLEETKPEQQDSQPIPVYMGLERLDEIAKDEPLFEGAAEFGNEKARVRLATMRQERKEIFEKYGISRELYEKYTKYGDFELLKNGKAVSQLLIWQEAQGLPPVKDGSIRMYRGEGPHPGQTEDWTVGRWFAHNLDTASSYPPEPIANSHIIYVDIPENDLAKFHVNDMPQFFGASKVGEYLLPPDVVASAKEFIRFIRADTKGDTWVKPQT